MTDSLETKPARVFPHAMLREIYEQPSAMLETVRRNVSGDTLFPDMLHPIENALFAFKKIIIAASGSSRHAGLVGEILMEDLAGIAVDVEYASEYCYRSTHAGADPIVLVITQSGETADTIAAQREAANRGAKTVAISNVANEKRAPLYTPTLVLRKLYQPPRVSRRSSRCSTCSPCSWLASADA